MSFDIEPDGDPHGECALEIHSLQERLKVAEQKASEFERQTMAQVERTQILFDGKNRIIADLRLKIQKLEETINYKPLEMKIPETAAVLLIEDDSRMAIEFGHEVFSAVESINVDPDGQAKIVLKKFINHIELRKKEL